MTRIMTYSISRKAPDEVSFVSETLASYLLEEDMDDFDLDLEELLIDAGMQDMIDDVE